MGEVKKIECDYCYHEEEELDLLECLVCGIKCCPECSTICSSCGEPIHYDCCNYKLGYRIDECPYCFDPTNVMEVLVDERY